MPNTNPKKRKPATAQELQEEFKACERDFDTYSRVVNQTESAIHRLGFEIAILEAERKEILRNPKTQSQVDLETVQEKIQKLSMDQIGQKWQNKKYVERLSRVKKHRDRVQRRKPKPNSTPNKKTTTTLRFTSAKRKTRSSIKQEAE